jgi:predicted dehydrogenase
MVCAVGQLEGGQIVNHVVNWLSPLKERQVVVTGEKGTFVANTLTSELIFYDNPGQVLTHRELAHFKGVAIGEIVNYSFDKPEPLFVELSNFVDFLRGKNSTVVTLRDGLRVIEVAEKLKSSFISE